MPMDLLCRLQSENRRLKEERDALAGAIGEAVVKMGVAQAVPMTGPELILMLQSAADKTPCTFPDCMSARAVRAAGEEYQRGVAEGLRLAVEAVEVLASTWDAGGDYSNGKLHGAEAAADVIRELP